MARSLRFLLASLPVIAACSGPNDAPRVEASGSTSEALANADNDVFDDTLKRDVVVYVHTDHMNCTGMLIAPRVVITARHCVRGSTIGGAFRDTVASIGIGTDRTDLKFIASDSGHPILPIYDSPIDGRDGDATSDVAIIYLPYTPPQSHAATGDLYITRSSFNTTPPATLSAAGYATESGPLRHIGQFIFPFGPVPNGTGSYLSSPGPASLRHGDSGGPLFAVRGDGTRDIRGIATRCWTNGTDCEGQGSDFTDVSSELVRNWIKAVVQDPSRTPKWLASHGKTAGDYWYGEADYVGPCTPSSDADCDHWWNNHDNCPNVPNPDQLDYGDLGIGDDCIPPPAPPPPPPALILTLKESAVTLAAGDSAPFEADTSGTTGPVKFTAAGLPSGVSLGTGNPVNVGVEGWLGFSADYRTTPQTANVTITATANGLSASQVIKVTVTACIPATSCNGACGTVSNGCGGTLQCGTCHTCKTGWHWDSDLDQCVKDDPPCTGRCI